MTLADRISVSQPAGDSTLDEIDDLLHEIGQLARSRISAGEFAEAVCQHSQRALAGAEVAIWVRRADHRWRKFASSSGDARDATRFSEPGNRANARVASYEIDGARNGAIEIVGGPPLSAAVADAIAELVGDFFRRERIHELAGAEQKWKQLSDVALRLHANLDVRETGYRIVNDGRNWIGCDRLSLLTVESGKVRTLAMSGIDRIDRRAAVVRALERLSAQVKRIREPVWYGFGEHEYPPEINDRLHEFLDHAPAKMLAVTPLMSADRCVALLVAECFEQVPAAGALRERLLGFAAHATEAIFNARQHARVPFARLFDRAGKADRLWWTSRIGMLALGVGALVATFTLVQADFSIEARGELQPHERREIYAPDDGVISQVNVEHGSAVAKGQPLLKLSNAELEFELARVRGELQTARTRLASARTKQLEAGRSFDAMPEETHQLAAEEEELKELIASLQQQLVILIQRDNELTVASPLPGKVLTWNVEPLLASRPVTRGQPLMTVADVEGAWELDLHLPDDRVGYLLQAQDKADESPAISYVLATDPKRVLQSSVGDVSQAAEFDERGEMTVQITAPVVAGSIASPRPGAEVIARIHCGRRSLGYVWFHDLVNAVRAWLYL